MTKKIFEEYTDCFNYKLMHRTPIVIHLNGRSFRRLTSFLNKPFSKDLSNCFSVVLYKLCLEIEGCIFGYSFNDEIILILRNDQHKETVPWYDNRLQKINSVSSSLATLFFSKAIQEMDLLINGDAVFLSNVFNLPKISECVSYLTMYQTKNFINSLNFACEYELLKQDFDKDIVKTMLGGTSIDDRKNILLKTCNIDYMDYPQEFRRGVAVYRFKENEKSKWVLDNELNVFSDNQSWLFEKLNFTY